MRSTLRSLLSFALCSAAALAVAVGEGYGYAHTAITSFAFGVRDFFVATSPSALVVGQMPKLAEVAELPGEKPRARAAAARQVVTYRRFPDWLAVPST